MTPESDHHPPQARPTPRSTPIVAPKPPPAGQARPLWLILLGVGLLAFCGVVGLTTLLLTLLSPPPPISITLIVSGAASQVQTTARTVGDLLREQGVTLNLGDQIAPPQDEPLTPNLIVSIERARAVTLTIDGQSQTFQTLYSNPVDILNSLGVVFDAQDRVLVDGTETDLSEMLVWPIPVTLITVQHALTIQIDDNGRLSSIQTTRPTIGEALFEAGIPLYLADSVTPDLNAAVTPDLRVMIRRSQPVTVIADDVTLETRTQGSTVGDALVSANVPLLGQDYAIPDENSPLQPGITIRVIRVSEKVEQQQDVIPFEVVFQADAELELDQRVVFQEGQNGIQQTDIRIRYENGVEVSRQAESTTVAVSPLNRVINYGTNIVVRTLETPDGPREYWRRLRMYATSYHPAALGGDNITATGRVLTKGIVGIDPKIIPYGTQLYVPDYGVGIAADTGGPRRFKLWIDLGYDDSNWISWSEYVDVYLLLPLPENIIYLLPE